MTDSLRNKLEALECGDLINLLKNDNDLFYLPYGDPDQRQATLEFRLTIMEILKTRYIAMARLEDYKMQEELIRFFMKIINCQTGFSAGIWYFNDDRWYKLEDREQFI